MSILYLILVAFGGGGVAVLLREGIKHYRRPKLELELLKDSDNKVIIKKRFSKIIDGSSSTYTKRMDVKDIYLKVKNNGHRPAKNCEARLKIFEEGERLYEPIRLGWRKRPPGLYDDLENQKAMRLRTQPINLNKKGETLLDLLRLKYKVYLDEETINYLNEEGKEPPHKEAEDFRTLASFNSHSFEKNTDYVLEVVVTSSNANPKSFKLKLNWSGKEKDKELRNSIEVLS